MIFSFVYIIYSFILCIAFLSEEHLYCLGFSYLFLSWVLIAKILLILVLIKKVTSIDINSFGFELYCHWYVYNKYFLLGDTHIFIKNNSLIWSRGQESCRLPQEWLLKPVVWCIHRRKQPDGEFLYFLSNDMVSYRYKTKSFFLL